MRVGIVGPGRAGTSMAVALDRAGYTIGAVFGRTPDSALRLAESVEGSAPAICGSLSEILDVSDLVVLSVPDSRIRDVADRLAASAEASVGFDRKLVIHLSGSLGNDVLDSLSRRGIAVGGFHPVRAFPHPSAPDADLSGTFFGLEGDEEVILRLRDLALSLNGVALEIDPGSKSLYHAAACVAANYSVALAEAALHLFQRSGIGEEHRRSLVISLMEQTVRNLRERHPYEVLTGPVSRGDSCTVQRHAESMAEDARPEVSQLYRALGEWTALRSFEWGRISSSQYQDVMAALSSIGERGCQRSSSSEGESL